MHTHTHNMQSQIEVVESASVLQVGGQLRSVRDLAYDSYQHLKELQSLIATDYSTREYLDTTIGEIHRHYDSEIQELKDLTASQSVVTALQQSQILTNEKLTSLENLVSCKVDRSQIATLDTLRLRLQNFAAFKDETACALESLESRCNVSEDLSRKHGEYISELQELTAEHTETLNVSTRTQVTDAIQREVAALKENLLENYTRITTFSALDEKVELLREDHSLTKEHVAGLKAQTAEIDETLLTKASVTQVKACVLRTHFEDIVKQMGNEMDLKAHNDELLRLERDQQEMMKLMGHEQQRVDVSMRFVDWFTQRGEGYEHNMRLIDKHLGKLTSISQPRDRTPYTGQIRMAPLQQGSEGEAGAAGRAGLLSPADLAEARSTTETLYSEEKTKGLLQELDTMLKMGF